MDASATAKGLAAGVQPSIWPLDEGDLDLFDKWISRWIFNLRMGPLEWPLSIPGCFFGMAPILIVGPPSLAVLAATSEVPSRVYLILSLLWLVTIYMWFAFCSVGPTWPRKSSSPSSPTSWGPCWGYSSPIWMAR